MNKLIIDTDISLLESAVNDDKCAIILPDLIQIRNFYNYLMKKGLKNVDTSNIYTVQSFITMILSPQNLELLPRFLERIITKDTILKLRDINPDYAELVNYPEFVSLFLEEFNTLKDNLDLDAVDNYDLDYFKKFNKLYSEKLTEYKLYTRRDLENQASEKLKNAEFKYLKVYFANFFIIDTVLLKLLESLLSIVTVVIMYFESEAITTIKERLKNFNPEIHRKEAIKAHNIQFLAVPDQRREVIAIARKTLEYISSKNLRYEDFIVAFRDAKAYELLIKEVFDFYDIPYFLEVRHRFQDLSIYIAYKNIVFSLINNTKTADQFLSDLIKNLENIRLEKEEYRDSINFINYLSLFNNYLEQLKVIYGRELTIRQLVNLLDIYIGTYTYGKLLSNRNVVKIIDIGNIFFNTPKYLFIGNMKEGVFPRSLDAKELVASTLKNRIPGFYYRNSYLDLKNEDYYFDTLLQSAENIIFTYSYRDQKAKREYQSKYLRKLESDGTITKQEYDPLKLSDSGTIFYAERELLYASLSNKSKNIVINDKNIEKELKDMNKLHDFLEITENQQELIDKIKDREFTPSELTQYKKCGLSYFYKYMLEINRPEELLGPINIGVLYHSILRDYYNDHRDFKNINDVDLKTQIKPYVLKYLEQFKNYIDPKTIEILELNITRLVYNFLMLDKQIAHNRVVYKVEHSFEWYIDGHKINGRIDRIDSINNSTFIVIDYKYTSSENLKKLETDLAMPIYIMYLRDQNLNIEKGKYYSLKINRFKYSPDLEKNFTKTIYIGTGEGKIDANKFKTELKSYIESIKSAKFVASPSEDCKYCEFYDICDYFLRGEDNELK